MWTAAGWIAASLLALALVADRLRRRRGREGSSRHGAASHGGPATTPEAALHLVAAVAHDLRSPLQAVLAGIEMASAEDLPPEAARPLELAARAARTLAGLTEDLLDARTARAGVLPVRLEVADVRDVLAEVDAAMRLLAASKGLAWNLEVGGEPAPLLVDSRRLRQVLLNLASNAVRYTDQGSVSVRVAYRSGGLILEVADTGRGMTPEEQARVFDPFWRAGRGEGPRGHGLGMALCRDAVEAMGGHIAVESAPGRGSTFRVELPLRRAERAA